MNYRSERYLRLAKGLPQRDIAKEAGVSITTVHHFEVGTGNIRPNTENRIRNVYADLYNKMRAGDLVLALAMQLKATGSRKYRKQIKEELIRHLDKV